MSNNSTKGLVTKSYLEDIADAIREKTGSSSEMMVSEMSGNILEIPSVTPTGTINIVANGSYDVATYGTASVAVPSVSPTGSYDVIENGSYDITDYAKVNVDVPQGVFPTGEYDITENGSYDITNYAKVNVDVQPTVEEIVDFLNDDGIGPAYTDLIDQEASGGPAHEGVYQLLEYGSAIGGWAKFYTLSLDDSYDITENGSYDVTNYAKVNVNVTGDAPAESGAYLCYNYSGDLSYENIDATAIGGWQNMSYGCYAKLGSGPNEVLDPATVIIAQITSLNEGESELVSDCVPSGVTSAVLTRAAATNMVIYSSQIPSMQVGTSISVTSGDGNHNYTLTRNT